MTTPLRFTDLPCPICFERPGDPCVSRQKNPLRYVHDERANLVSRTNRQQEEADA